MSPQRTPPCTAPTTTSIPRGDDTAATVASISQQPATASVPGDAVRQAVAQLQQASQASSQAAVPQTDHSSQAAAVPAYDAEVLMEEPWMYGQAAAPQPSPCSSDQPEKAKQG